MRAWLPRPTSVPIRPPTSRPATTVLRQRNVPEAIRSLSTLAKPDYVDLFTVATVAAADRSPEQWARAAIEDAGGLAGQFIWRVVLGLRLERRPSLDHVGGWKIGDRDDNWVRLEAASWFLTAQIVVQVDPEQVSVATFIRYDRPMAAVIWPPLSIGHRQAMPGLLRLARERELRPPWTRRCCGASRSSPFDDVGERSEGAPAFDDVESEIEHRRRRRRLE